MPRDRVPPEEVQWDEVIRECERGWMEAVKTHDMDALGGYLAEEFELVSASVGFADRAEYMRVIPGYELDDYEFIDADVHVHGDWAIAHCRYRQSGRLQGRNVSHNFFFTDVWIFRDGRWQVVTRHSSTPTKGAWEQAERRASS